MNKKIIIVILITLVLISIVGVSANDNITDNTIEADAFKNSNLNEINEVLQINAFKNSSIINNSQDELLGDGSDSYR